MFIELKLINKNNISNFKEEIFVNLNKVESVIPMRSGEGCKIFTGTDEWYDVKETYEEVKKIIKCSYNTRFYSVET